MFFKSKNNVHVNFGNVLWVAFSISSGPLSLVKYPVYGKKHLSIDNNSRIYKSVVRPLLICTAETRPVTKISWRILETVKILMKITNQTLRDRARSDGIRKTCKVDNTNEWIRGWKKNTERMTDNRMVKLARNNHQMEEDQQKKEAVWRYLNKRFRIEERTGKLPTNTQKKEEYVTDQ
jgi:hypothetical protein